MMLATLSVPVPPRCEIAPPAGPCASAEGISANRSSAARLPAALPDVICCSSVMLILSAFSANRICGAAKLWMVALPLAFVLPSERSRSAHSVCR